MLEEGDWIVHKQHGVGQIRGVEQKKIGKNIHEYFRVKVSSGVYWLPIEKIPDYVRTVSTRYKFRKVFRIISKAPEELQRNYKERNREIALRLESTTLESSGALIRDLDAWRRLEGVNLSAQNERQLTDLRKQFLREMIIVLGIEMDKAEEKLDKALDKSFSQLN